MNKKKVTLSIDSKVYGDFRDYCDRNAIMLSKKIELFMKNILKDKKKFLSLAFFSLLSIFLIFVGGSVFQDSSQGDFNNGTYLNTTHNSSAVVLFGTNLTGTFTSRVFDAGAGATWNNLTFGGGQPSVEALFAGDGLADIWKSVNGGATWTKINDDYNGGDGNQGTRISRNSTYSLFILDEQAVWRSIDNALNWTKVNSNYNGAESQQGVAFTVDNSNSFFIIESDQDVWKSTDNAISWTKINGTDFNGGKNVVGMVANNSNSLFVVDVASNVWTSINSGITWALAKDDYNGADSDGAIDLTINKDTNMLFILDEQAVWKSTDNAISWTKINTDFNGAGSSSRGVVIYFGLNNNTLYVIDAAESIYSSTNNGTNFSLVASNYNAGGQNAFALTSINATTNLAFMVKNCSSSDCSDGTFSNVNFNNLGLTGRYFQYKVLFSTQETAITPFIQNVSIDYQIEDTSAPNLTIISPEANFNYTTDSILVNISAADSNLDSIWFYNGSTNITYTAPVFHTFAQGNITLIAYANDTFGNNNRTNVSFFVDSIGPVLTIAHPQNITYGTNSSLSLNFTSRDTTSSVSSCWYNVDNGQNNTLINCQNTTFNVDGHGNHTLFLFSNDTLNNLGNSTVSFFADLNFPILSIEFPSNGSYYSTNALNLNYTASDDTLNTCWYSLNNGATNTTITCGSDVGGLTALEGLNHWAIFANDSFGRESSSDSFFTVDTILPSVILTEPVGAKTSRTDVPVAFSVTDANAANCWYNVYRGIDLEVANKSVDCGIGVNFFDVTVDANFVLTFYANDSAGNINLTNSSFSVTTSGGGGSGGNSNGGGDSGSGGGGGGGGGASSSADKKINVEFASLERILIKRGTQATANLLVTNTGKSFLNSCKLRFDGTGGEWFSSTQTKGLSSGEKFSFAVEVVVPDSAEPGEYSVKTVIVCDEGEAESSILIAPYRNQFEALIKDYEKDGTNLKVSYILQEFAGLEHEILIDYSLIDFDGVARYKGQEKVFLGARVTTLKEIIFALPKDSFGEFKFAMELTDGVSQSKTEKEVFLPSGGLFTGFTLFENGKIKLSSFGMILIVLILLAAGFILYRRFRRHAKKVEVGFGKKRKRKLIALDM